MSDQWLSIAEYARTYSLSDMTVRRRIKTGRLHAVLREGKYFIPRKEEASKPSGAARIQRPEHFETEHLNHVPQAAPRISQPTVSFASPASKEMQANDSLVRFCEASLRNFEETKREITMRHQAEINALQARLAQKDHEIERLKGEIEDFKLLLEKINEYKAA